MHPTMDWNTCLFVCGGVVSAEGYRIVGGTGSMLSCPICDSHVLTYITTVIFQ